eukprot:scaffold11442_cov177-Amphora_coffeaeformis.AAC.2
MAAVRQVIDNFEISLDLSKDFAACLPPGFLEDEPHRERLMDIWNRDVQKAISDLFRTRRNSVLMNRHTKKAVFESAMENICVDFSRRAENVNVHFVPSFTVNGVSSRRIKTYYLKVTKLSPITDEQRNARSCVAEIPLPTEEVEAEFVGTVEISGFTEPVISESSSSARDFSDFSSGAVPSAPVEILVTTAASVVQYEDAIHDVNPPLASEVMAIVEDDDPETVTDYSHRAALDRMKELESIKLFLSEVEYTAKRQAIVDSI